MDAISDGGNLNRRDFACGAAAAALAAWLLDPATAEAALPGGGTLQAFDKVAPQQFDWGWIRWLMNAQIDPQAEMTLGIVEIKPNQSNPLHIHPNSAEYLHVISGACEHRLGDEWFAMQTGDTLRVPKNVPHCARTKDQPCRALVVYDTGTRIMQPVT